MLPVGLPENHIPEHSRPSHPGPHLRPEVTSLCNGVAHTGEGVSRFGEILLLWVQVRDAVHWRRARGDGRCHVGVCDRLRHAAARHEVCHRGRDRLLRSRELLQQYGHLAHGAQDSAVAPPAKERHLTSVCLRLVESDRQQKNAQRFKYPKWWIQSHIVGVPQIAVGYWSKDGTLSSIASIRTEDLPARAMDGISGYRRQQVCSVVVDRSGGGSSAVF